MNLYETFSKPPMTDSAKEFPLSETASITLLPLTGEKSKREFQKLMEPYTPRLKAGGTLTEGETKSINLRHFSETVIAGWKGIKGAKGEEIKFSPDVAKALLGDPKLESFFDLIAKMAANEQGFTEAQQVEDEGN